MALYEKHLILICIRQMYLTFDYKMIYVNKKFLFSIFQSLRLSIHHNYKTIFPFFKSFWVVPRLTSLRRLLKYSINWRAECSFKINRGLYIPSTIAFSIAHAIMYTEIWIFDILHKVSNCLRPYKKTKADYNFDQTVFLQRWWEYIRNAFWWLIYFFTRCLTYKLHDIK